MQNFKIASTTKEIQSNYFINNFDDGTKEEFNIFLKINEKNVFDLTVLFEANSKCILLNLESVLVSDNIVVDFGCFKLLIRTEFVAS